MPATTTMTIAVVIMTALSVVVAIAAAARIADVKIIVKGALHAATMNIAVIAKIAITMAVAVIIIMEGTTVITTGIMEGAAGTIDCHCPIAWS